MKPLRVALDGTPLTVETGGVQRYVAELSDALRRSFPDDEYAIVSDQLSRPETWIDRRWWLWGVQREMDRLGSQLFHGTDFAVPYLPLRPAVMTLHDLSPWREETRQAASRRVRRRTPVLLQLGLASMVITPSEVVRREAMQRFSISPERIVAVPLAASVRFRPLVMDPPGRPYFVYVGTVERRKNIGVLVDSWRELRKTTEVDLVIAGRLKDPLDVEGVKVLGAVPEADLPSLYAGAVAALYPSLYEGFGLPVLEAMQCGTMTIASRDPAITEVAAGAALQVDARDVRGWVEAMRSAMVVSSRNGWCERGLRRASGFSWERTARLTREVYVEALRRR